VGAKLNWVCGRIDRVDLKAVGRTKETLPLLLFRGWLVDLDRTRFDQSWRAPENLARSAIVIVQPLEYDLARRMLDGYGWL
jgi:hypothetical protein